MHRILITATALLALAAPAAAQLPAAPLNPSPAKAVQAAPKTSTFTTRVHVASGTVASASSAACNRRAVGVAYATGEMSINGATDSRTLIAVPIGAGSLSSATTQQQLTDVCDHN